MTTPVKALAIATAACLGIASPPSPEAHAQGGSCLVTTVNGDIQGQDRGASCAFLGVPFARPPIGSLRWRPPQPAQPWTGVLDATVTPATCALIGGNGLPAGREDCLRLNLWVRDPLPTAPAPVIVWLHTGGFTAASANFASHNGQRLAEETGAIVVAPNYRLGPFGFLAHAALAAEDTSHPTSGNYGLLDQRAALEWVRDNIARFGGDPGRVTLAGTSAGAQSVGLHLVSPGSGGLFHRAVVQSSYPTVRETTQADGAIQGEAFAQALGCTVPSEVLSCMRSREWSQVLTALLPATEAVVEQPTRTVWRPVVDGVEIPDQPRTLLEAGLFHRVPTITGTTRDEGWVFVARSFTAGVSPAQYDTWVWSEFGAAAPNVLATYPVASFPSATDAMARLVGDVQFVCEARRLARAIERTGTPVFQYSYEYEIDALSLDRVIHGVESNILFGNAYVPPYAVHPLDAQDLALHAAMSGYWTRFAATGNPNADDLDVVHWPAFKHPTADGRGSDKLLVLASEIRADKRVQEDQCDFWEPMFLRSVIGAVPAWTP